jgi:hypothetical protein
LNDILNPKRCEIGQKVTVYHTSCMANVEDVRIAEMARLIEFGLKQTDLY